MRKIFVFIILCLIACININAQRVSTQQFMVRKITFKVNDQIVPINGVSVEINKAKFRSDKAGLFTANIPVAKDMSFYISNITAPGYIVSIPEDLSKKVYLSSNQFVIVLADINAVKAERTRIYNNNKAALAKQEDRLNSEVKKNQELLKKFDKKESEYNEVLAELEKVKRQLESFNNAKSNLEEKIDSLSDNLSMVDIASLDSDEQKRIEKEKDGEWIDAIVDEVISKLETNLNTKHSSELIEVNKQIKKISDDYYLQFIKGNTSFATNYFAYHYDGYLRTKVSDMRKKKDKVLDRILDKIIEEDLDELIENHVDSCYTKWKVKETNENEDYQRAPKTLKSAKEDFLNWALYPDKESALRKVSKPKWDTRGPDKAIVATIKKVYSGFYNQCKTSSTKYAVKFNSLTNEDLYKLSDPSMQYSIQSEVQDAIRKDFTDETDYPYYEFENLLIAISATEAIEPVRIRYDELIENDIKEVEKQTYPSIENKIKPISSEKHHTNVLSWSDSKNIESYREEYNKLSQTYSEYTSFLYPIVMQFMQPIITKYDCDEALYTWESSMDNDIMEYCFRAIRNYSNKLSYIPNVKGSNDKCMDIVRAIVEIEKQKIIDNHNEKIKNVKLAKQKEEESTLANMKKRNIKKFAKEEDIIAFLATHKYVNKDFGMSSWYDSKISKWYMDYGHGETYYDISYEIVEWNSNSAKLKLKIDRGGAPIIVQIQLNSNSSSYSESVATETRHFSVIDK